MKIRLLGAPATASVPSFLLLNKVNLSTEPKIERPLDIFPFKSMFYQNVKMICAIEHDIC